MLFPTEVGGHPNKVEIIYGCLKGGVFFFFKSSFSIMSYMGGKNGLTQQVTMFVALKTEGKMCRFSALCCHTGTLIGVSTDGGMERSSS